MNYVGSFFSMMMLEGLPLDLEVQDLSQEIDLLEPGEFQQLVADIESATNLFTSSSRDAHIQSLLAEKYSGTLSSPSDSDDVKLYSGDTFFLVDVINNNVTLFEIAVKNLPENRFLIDIGEDGNDTISVYIA